MTCKLYFNKWLGMVNATFFIFILSEILFFYNNLSKIQNKYIEYLIFELTDM